VPSLINLDFLDKGHCLDKLVQNFAIAGNLDCWSRLVALEYNETSGKFSNHRGVETLVRPNILYRTH
jgi:hypothetical protein